MSQKRKRRSSVVEFGNGPTRVKIYTINRKDGYSEFTLVWKEGGRRRTRSLSDMEEARMVAQQITVRLANGWEPSNEVLRLISSIDEFKGEWRAVETIKSERLQSFRRVATVVEAAAATDANRNRIKDKFT